MIIIFYLKINKKSTLTIDVGDENDLLVRAKELERQKVLFEEKVKNEHYVTSSVKFEALAKEWIAQAELEGNLKVLTMKRLKQCQERTYMAIGHLPVGKITTMHIQKFINNLF